MRNKIPAQQAPRGEARHDKALVVQFTANIPGNAAKKPGFAGGLHALCHYRKNIGAKVVIIRMQMRNHVASSNFGSGIHGITDAATDVFQQLVRTRQIANTLQCPVVRSTIDEYIFDVRIVLSQYGRDGLLQKWLTVPGAGNDAEGQGHR